MKEHVKPEIFLWLHWEDKFYYSNLVLIIHAKQMQPIPKTTFPQISLHFGIRLMLEGPGSQHINQV